MRYYDLTIGGSSGSSSGGIGSDAVAGGNSLHYTSHPNGQYDPAALRISFECNYFTQGDGTNPAHVRIYGVPLAIVNTNFLGKTLTLRGGMKPGLPFATAQSGQSDQLLQGNILFNTSQWQGQDLFLDFTVTPATLPGGGGSTDNTTSGAAVAQEPTTGRAVGGVSVNKRFISGRNRSNSRSDINQLDNGIGGVIGNALSSLIGDFSQVANAIAGSFGGGGLGQKPVNLIHNWQPNTPLSQAIQQTLSTAFQGVKLIINISSNLKLTYQDAGVYSSLTQYAAYIKSISHSILGTPGSSGYLGVHTFTNPDGSMTITDFSQQSGGQGIINIWDLIGQPCWYGSQVGFMQFKTILRGDLRFGESYKLPQAIQGPQLLGTDANPWGVSGPLLNASPTIKEIHYYGDSRATSDNSWCSIYVGFINSASSTSSSGGIGSDSVAGGAPAQQSNIGGAVGPVMSNRKVRRYA